MMPVREGGDVIRFRRLACSALVAIATFAGCATRTHRADSGAPDTPLLTTYEAQVALGDCVFRPAARDPAIAAALGTAIASGAVTQGVNYLARAIEEAAKGTSDRITAARNVEVTAETFGPCVQVIRGWFYRGFDSAAQQADMLHNASRTWARAGAGPLDAAKVDLFWKRRLWVAGQPDFVFEAEVQLTDLATKPNTRALTLSPVYARLDDPISNVLLRPSASREVAVFFAFHEATADPSAPSNASGGLALGRLERGVDVRFPPPDPWTVDTRNRPAGESRWFTVALGTTKRPMTVTALVTEHQDASVSLAFLADVLTGARAPIGTAVQSGIVPSLQAQAEDAEAARMDALQSAYEEALNRALAAATACSAKVTDALDAASEARARVRTLNRNARALGRSGVGDGLVPFVTDAAAVQAGCVRLLDSLRGLL